MKEKRDFNGKTLAREGNYSATLLQCLGMGLDCVCWGGPGAFLNATGTGDVRVDRWKSFLRLSQEGKQGSTSLPVQEAGLLLPRGSLIS